MVDQHNKLSKILKDASEGIFDKDLILKNLDRLKTYTDKTEGHKGNRLLHYVAQYNNLELAEIIIGNGVDIHHENNEGKTAFNYAAANSPDVGGCLTIHWFKQAIRGESLGLDEGSGSYKTPIAQYIAKWCSVKEIRKMMYDAAKSGKEIDFFVRGTTNWTPLHGASVMIGQHEVVKFLAKLYYEKRPDLLKLKTIGKFSADYIHNGTTERVTYPGDALAEELPKSRLKQNNVLGDNDRESLNESSRIISHHRKMAERYKETGADMMMR